MASLAKLMVGDAVCEWAPWFQARYWYDRLPDTLDVVKWRMEHNRMLRLAEQELRVAGFRVTREKQNSFEWQYGSVWVAGTPDLLSTADNRSTVIDCKTGRRYAFHAAQVMIYMALLPRARVEYAGIALDGLLRYRDGDLAIPASVIGADFVAQLESVLQIVASPEGPSRSPAAHVCQQCNISKIDCADRVGRDWSQEP